MLDARSRRNKLIAALIIVDVTCDARRRGGWKNHCRPLPTSAASAQSAPLISRLISLRASINSGINPRSILLSVDSCSPSSPSRRPARSLSSRTGCSLKNRYIVRSRERLRSMRTGNPKYRSITIRIVFRPIFIFIRLILALF